MYSLDPYVIRALDDYRREQLLKSVRGVDVRSARKARSRIHLAWPPWPARGVRRRRVAHQGA